MKTRGKLLFLCIAMGCYLFAASWTGLAQADTQYVYNPNPQDRLNLREGPAMDTPSLGRFYTGTQAEVLGQEGDFAKVQIGRLEGYMLGKYLAEAQPDAPALTFATVLPREDAGASPLYAKADENATVLDRFAPGTVLQVMGREGNFIAVRTPERDGYLSAAHVQVDGEPGKAHIADFGAGLVIVEELPIYSYPDEGAALIDREETTPHGTEIYTLGTAGTWYFVRTDGGQVGFIPHDAIYLDGGIQVGPLAVVSLEGCKGTLPLYEGPSADSAVLGRYLCNTQVEVMVDEASRDLEEGNFAVLEEHGFYKVRVDGREGYMASENLSMLSMGGSDSW